MSKYRDYFSIDEDYFPSVNAELINSGKVDWRKLYPHETFLRLLKDMESVLSRRQKLSIWVEGAYGTGKSHVVLTLKKLLDSSDDEMREYFDRYGLSIDLYNKLTGAKHQGTILTIHRYGSSSIRNDRDLILAIQESIMATLDERGIKNKGEEALKDAVIRWLSDVVNKKYFGELISGRFLGLFEGDTPDKVIEKLQTYSDESLILYMGKIFKVAEEVGITALTLDINSLKDWIVNIIQKNNLKAIVFIWDEFTEYFLHNSNALTGFQSLAELSETKPFYFVIVTHKSAALFHDTDSDKKKILNRFVDPTCRIELPENMAFKLMGAALEKKDNPIVREEWNTFADELNDRMTDSRRLVMQSAHITEQELKDILPIHPYTALLLKYLSTAFDSNQRSMFDFIKNDRGDEIKGFQWFIDNFGPEGDNPLLTIDMLWDFFYEKGKEHLKSSIRSILDAYARQNAQSLGSEQKKVLKTTLLLQAISQDVGDSVELFIPNDKNVNNAFDGTDLEGRASHIAEGLVRAEVLYKKPIGQNKFQYSSMLNASDSVAIEKEKNRLEKDKKTQDLVNEGELTGVLNLSGALGLRFVLESATADNFRSKINTLRGQELRNANKFVVVVMFARSDEESISLEKQVKQAVTDPSYHLLFLDTSLSPLGPDGFSRYLEDMANSSYQRTKDNDLSKEFDKQAKDVLASWRNKIAAGEFILYTAGNLSGVRLANLEAVYDEFRRINFAKYRLGLEQFNVIENMYTLSNLKFGAECGLREKVSGTFLSSNPATKLDAALCGAWGMGKYWEASPTLLISKIKVAIDSEIQKQFQESGRISIDYIYNMLMGEPYGFMPCNLTAFVLGFLLKEYAVDTYRWTDDQTSESMSINKIKEMIDEIIKLQVTTNPRYKDKYIVAMTKEERSFTQLTAAVFRIPENQCLSIQQTRDRIRSKMKELSFPIWCLKEILAEFTVTTPPNVLSDIIDAYSGIANNHNVLGSPSEMDLALKIGRLSIEYPEAAADLCQLVTKSNCMKGMAAYIAEYQGGILLSLTDEISDNGEYINVLRDKFDADAANWVWNVATAEKKIDEVILEYRIIAESNKINSKANTFAGMICEWCDKAAFIKLAYEAIKTYVGDLKPFLEILVAIKKNNNLQDSQKEKFLSLLQTVAALAL